MQTIREIEGDLFDAPDGAALIHACNCQGSWGKGIAQAFRERYPAAFAIYRSHCQSTWPKVEYKTISKPAPNGKSMKIRLPEGTALIIPPQKQDYEAERADEGKAKEKEDTATTTMKKKHWIICLFTSRQFGKNVSPADTVLANTELAIADMKGQLARLAETRVSTTGEGDSNDSGPLQEQARELFSHQTPASNMPAERQPAQKRRRLPFNPPRPRASPGEGPSTSAPKSTAKEKPSTTSATKPKPKRKSTTTAAASSSRKKSAPPAAESPSPSASASGSDEADSDGADARNRRRGPSEEPEYILAEITHGKPSEDVTSSEPAIPGKLLTRLLHHNFQNEKTKIAKDANEVVAKYVDVFVREALARAAYERAEGGEGGGGRGTIGDGFLEVEDLEKMAPQLVLDF